MKQQQIKESKSIGVDVSKATLDITAYFGSGKFIHLVITNKRSAVKKWLKVLQGYGGLIICESTSWYHYLFAHLCYEADLDIRVLNPLLASKHSKSAIRKVKSDPVDSLGLAIMGVTEPNLPPRPKLTQERLAYRKKQGLLHGLVKQIQSMRRRMNDYQECVSTMEGSLSETEQLLCDEVKHMEKLKRALERELEKLAKSISQSEQSENYDLFKSVPGYSSMVSRMLDVTLDPFVKGAKSWIAYVGNDVSVRESGTWKGRGRLTKRGNGYLRCRLYQAAWGACLNFPEIRSYYDGLKAGGRDHVEAVTIIARKQLGIAFALVRKQEKYDTAKAIWC